MQLCDVQISHLVFDSIRVYDAIDEVYANADKYKSSEEAKIFWNKLSIKLLS